MKRAAIFTLLALLATAVAGLGVAAYAQEPPPPGVVVEKVEICHKPPTPGRQTVSVESIVKDEGHDNDPTDIIPPFTYDGGHFPGKNWDLQGQATWYYDCNPAAIPDVTPLLDCVEVRPGEVLAHFGYRNGAGKAVNIAVGLVNAFSPPPGNRAQPTAFQTGTRHDVFQVAFLADAITWRLAKTTVTASRSSRQCQASIRIDKALDPTSDPGRFDLLLDGKALATGVGQGGTTDTQAVTAAPAGTAHAVGERAAAGTSLADYDTSIVCRADGGQGAIVAQGQGTSLTVTARDGDAIVCVILNARRPAPGPGQADLLIVKSAEPVTLLVGGKVTWRVTLTNKGPDAATNVVVEDSLPADVSFVDGSLVVPDGVTCVGARCTLASLGPGDSVTGHFVTTTTAIGWQTNVVTVGADQDDPNPADNAASAQVLVTGLIDETVRPIVECVDRQPDGSYRAHFGYLNRSAELVDIPIGARNAFTPTPEDRGQPRQFHPGRFADVFQVGFQDTVVWTLGSRSVTASPTAERCTPPGGLRVDKLLQPVRDPGRFDLQIDGVVAGTGRAVGHLGTTGDVDVGAGLHRVGEVGAGTTSLADYETTIVCRTDRGRGPVTSAGVGPEILVDVPEGDVVVCTILNRRRSTPVVPPTPPPGPTPLPPPAPGTADLAVRKFVDRAVGRLGDVVRWTIVVTNNGPETATGVTIVDRAAAGATFVSLSVPQGRCARITCALGTIAPGASVRIVARTRALVTGARLNGVGVTGLQPDSNPENNVASALVRILAGFSPPLAERCGQLSVDRKTARAEVPVNVNALVRNVFGRPLAGTMVSARGAGQATRARTNADGVARFRLAATRAGTVRVTVGARTLSAAGARRCAAQVGVRGFGGVLPAESPPFTG